MEPEFEINDVREQKDFSTTTLSEFKKSEVKKEFLKSLRDSLLEPSCFWCAELICSGHYIDIWDTIILFYSRYIQQGCPGLCLYIERRVNNFREIARTGYAGNELLMRNNEKIRKLFAEIICVLCDASKRHPYEEVKIDESYFIMTNLTKKLKAPNVSFANTHFKDDDPKELFIAINELAYSVSSEGHNLMMACFWIEWLLSYQRICKTKKEFCLCEKRMIVEIDEKYQRAIDWVVWEILLSTAEKHIDKRIPKMLRSLLNLYSLKFSAGVFRKRRYLVYLAVSLLVDSVSLNGEIISKETKQKIIQVQSTINSVYKQIKAKEKRPPSDYLFTNIKQTNLEKSIQKLDKLQEFNEKFTPRT